ncbi:hypothetical protein [Roseimaritima ulvae]|uniref:hypothetical protein n=1 Tax=Roseimaritima ulvae TaxID=980254 RepID=UPI00082DAA75|nr:hypothetical protein [Roseimaritima ulvae]
MGFVLLDVILHAIDMVFGSACRGHLVLEVDKMLLDRPCCLFRNLIGKRIYQAVMTDGCFGLQLGEDLFGGRLVRRLGRNDAALTASVWKGNNIVGKPR